MIVIPRLFAVFLAGFVGLSSAAAIAQSRSSAEKVDAVAEINEISVSDPQTAIALAISLAMDDDKLSDEEKISLWDILDLLFNTVGPCDEGSPADCY